MTTELTELLLGGYQEAIDTYKFLSRDDLTTLNLEGEAAELMDQIKTYIPNADVEGVLTKAIYDMDGFEGTMGTWDYTQASDLRQILGRIQNVHEPIANPPWRIGFARSQGERLELREVWLDSHEELINSANDYGRYSRQLTHYSSDDLIPRREESVEMTEIRQDVLERREINLDAPEPPIGELMEDDPLFDILDEDDELLDLGPEDFEGLDEAEIAAEIRRTYDRFRGDIAAYDEAIELEPLLRQDRLEPFEGFGPEDYFEEPGWGDPLVEAGGNMALEAPILGAVAGALYGVSKLIDMADHRKRTTHHGRLGVLVVQNLWYPAVELYYTLDNTVAIAWHGSPHPQRRTADRQCARGDEGNLCNTDLRHSSEPPRSGWKSGRP